MITDEPFLIELFLGQTRAELVQIFMLNDHLLVIWLTAGMRTSAATMVTYIFEPF